MWFLMAAFAAELEIEETRFRVDGEPIEVGDVQLSASGYGYRIVRDESCVGIAVEGPSSAQLPTDLLRTHQTWHEIDQILVLDPDACGLLVEPIVLQEDADDVVVVTTRKRDRSLARLRRSLKERAQRLGDWGLAPSDLQPGQRIAEVQHVDGTGRVDAEGTGWSTLIDDPYQQVEFGVRHLALESSKHGAPRPVHRRSGERRGVWSEQTTLNMNVIDLGFTHKVEFQARLTVRCSGGPCSHVSILVPVTHEEMPKIITHAPEFEMGEVRVGDDVVEPTPAAFGRSAAHAPFAYRPFTVPLDLQPDETATVDLAWSDRWFLGHAVPVPIFASITELNNYIEWHKGRPGPERATAVDMSREALLDQIRESTDVSAHIPGLYFDDQDRSVGMRPRTVVPVVVGQASAPPTEARLVRPSTGMPIWLHGTDVETREGRLQIATSQSGGPWVGAGRYKEDLGEGGLALYLSTPFLRPKAPLVSSRMRALHEIFSAQLGVRALDLALFEAPRTSGIRPSYGAASGMAWLGTAIVPSSATEDGLSDADSLRRISRANFVEPEDRAFIYAISKQWFDRPTATLEPWLQGAFTEVYADLVFEAVHGAPSATPWRSRPDRLQQEAFADFGMNDWSPEQQVAYAARALELVRTSVGPKFFNKAVRNMLETDGALSADLLAKHFVQERDQTLVRDALIRGICPTVTATWSQDRFQRGKVKLTTDYTAAPLVVPVVIVAKGVKQQHFVKFKDGAAELDLSARMKIKQIAIDPYNRLPLCHTEVKKLDEA